jgi:putative transposase|nr:transposase [uncultured Acetatifactor sp.]
MHRSRTLVRKYTAEDECLKLWDILKGKSILMIYDVHPELQNKWNKAFWARGYYVATIGNLTEEAIKKYIAEQSEESRKEDSEGAAF